MILTHVLAANAQEIVTDAMGTNLEAAFAAQPRGGDLSLLEVSSFCSLTHLSFRDLGTLEGYPRLRAFTVRFDERPSAQATPYRFDQAA